MVSHQIIVNSNCYHKYPIERAIEGISRIGYKHIELTATKGWTEHVFPSQSFSSLLAVKQLLKKSGIDVPALSGHCNLMDKERLKDFDENINLADFFSARVIVSSIGEAHLKDKAKAGDEELIDNLMTLLPILEEKDITLALETHGEHGSAMRIKSIVDKINSRHIGICYDSANVIFYGGIIGASDLEQAVDRVSYFHIKDKGGEQKEWDFPALGDGYVDFPALIDVLDKNGNTTALSIEIEFTSSGSSSPEEVDNALARSGDYLKKLGYNI